MVYLVNAKSKKKSCKVSFLFRQHNQFRVSLRFLKEDKAKKEIKHC